MGNKSMRRKKQWSDLNFNLILNELNNYNNLNNKTTVSTFIRIKRELKHLMTNQCNYFLLNNSDQFLVDVLCSTFFSRQEQLDLIRLYIDYTNLLQTANKINLDDLFLSCVEATTVKCSDLLLDECLKYNLDRKIEQNELLNGFTVLDIALNTFGIKLYPIIKRTHKLKSVTDLTSQNLDDTYSNINEYEMFILKLIYSGFKLSFKSLNYDKCFLVLMFVNLRDLLLIKTNLNGLVDYLNKSLVNLIDCLLDKRMVYLTLSSVLSQNEHLNSDVNFYSNLKECLYYQIKKSTLSDHTIINKYTSEKLNSLILDSNRRFNPLRLDEQCRKKIKSIYPNTYSKFTYLPLKINRFLSYYDEMSKNFLFYYFYFL